MTEKSILVVTFEEEKMADKALITLEDMHLENMFKIADAVVISKDFHGHVTIRETAELTTRKGAVSGGVAGLVIGTLLGGPIGGALLGAAAGAITGKVVDLGIPEDKIQEVSTHLDNVGSALILMLKAGDLQKLAAALEETGGQVIELAIPDELHMELESTLDEMSIESKPDEDGTDPGK